MLSQADGYNESRSENTDLKYNHDKFSCLKLYMQIKSKVYTVSLYFIS